MKTHLISLLLFILCFNVKANDLISKNIDLFNEKYPTEKVYLHFDNNSYFLGDTIWFKAYVRDGQTGLRSDISKVLYVELLCELGYVRETKKLKIIHGVCNGFFSLSDSLYRSGFYEIRAKTRGMLSFGNESKNIISRQQEIYIGKIRGEKSSNNQLFDKLNNSQSDGRDIISNEQIFENVINSEQDESDILSDNRSIEEIIHIENDKEVDNNRAIENDVPLKYKGRNNKWHYLGFMHPGLNISSNINYYQFSRVIPIYEKVSDGAYTIKNIKKDQLIGEGRRSIIKEIFVNFYPEGGDIVKGVKSKVAFDVKDKAGKPINVKGFIRNNKGETITEIETVKEGIGCFYINPVTGDNIENNLTAFISYEGEQYKFDLPKAKDSGFTISTDISDKEIVKIKIDGSVPQTLEMKHDSINLVIISPKNKATTYSVIAPDKSAKIIEIPKEVFEVGINRIVLSDYKGKAWSDRLIYIGADNDKTYNISISGLKKKYKPYEKADIEFTVTDKNNNPVVADFSVAVRDKASMDLNYNTDNIESYFTLNCDLGRFLPNSRSYIADNKKQTKADLDLLLLATRRRRYKWDELMHRTHPVINYRTEKSLSLCGYVIDPIHSYRKDKIKMFGEMMVEAVMTFDTIEIAGEVRADEKGFFNFSLPDYYGRVYTKIDVNEKESPNIFKSLVIRDYLKKYYIPLDRIVSTFPREYDYYEKKIISKSISLIEDSEINNDFDKAVDLENVTVKAKRKSLHITRGKPIYKGDILEEFNNSIDIGCVSYGNMSKFFLRGHYVDGIEQVDPDFKYSYPMIWCNNPIPGYKTGIWDVFVVAENDEADILKKVDSTDFRSFLHLSSIEKVEIYSNYGPRTMFDKEFLWSTNEKSTDMRYYFYKTRGYKRTAGNSLRMLRFDGFSYGAKFNMPDYSKGINPDLKDYRRTLYWNPTLITDENGKAKIEFYNNTTTSEFDISIETLTFDGVPVVFENR